MLLADGERVRACEGSAQTVGDRIGDDRTRLARFERRVERGRAFRLGGDDARSTADRGRDPGDQPAAARRDDDDLDVGPVLEELEADGALA